MTSTKTDVDSGANPAENLTGIMKSSPLTVGSAGTDIDAIVDARSSRQRPPRSLTRW